MTASKIFRPAGGGATTAPKTGRLKEVENFGANPGSLRMLAYAPKGLPRGAPLVVVLHGCTQTAEGYDAHAGWTALADELGFAVLYPEQRKANNPNGCFNWFLLADSARGLGETRSIREMVAAMGERHKTDPARVFVTGLSAGGAMTAALLKDYPEVFSAGAVIAGLPCGVAANVQEAFQAMSHPRDRTAEDLGDAVRAGSPHLGPWPRVSIWQGAADKTVAPKNADDLVKQWTNVHGVKPTQFREDQLGGHRRRVWSADGRHVVESVLIAGMGHGTPLDGRRGERPGPFMLDVGLSSTRAIAAFFGLQAPADIEILPRERADSRDHAHRQREEQTAAPEVAAFASGRTREKATDRNPRPGPDGPDRAGARAKRIGKIDIGAVINRALKAAGLMK